MRESHYLTKGLHYGIAHTRLRKILELAGDRHDTRVLDVGCARGYLGRRIREQGNYVAGVEISPLAAQEAQKVLDKVYTFDIEREWPPELRGEKFDLVILAEILEHVFDPVEVLGYVQSVLRPEGEVIITTPNLLLWTNRFRFLFGRFRYTEEGTFDFGHIRFFTYLYLQEVLQKAGLVLKKENHIIFPGKLTALLRHWPSMFASQFIIKAEKLS